VNNRSHDLHLSAEQLQAFLDGALPERDAAGVEEHLAACPRCASEMDGWRLVFDDLGTMTRSDALMPSRGFADRVMAEVAVPGLDAHVATELLYDFLDGTLAGRQARRVEDHLRACPPCTAEADAWLAVMRRLEELGSLAPSDGFSARVMAAVEIRERTTRLARLRARALKLVRPSAPLHVPEGILQDFVDGILPARAVARLEAHVDGCARCRDRLRSWQAVTARLRTLERHAPAPDFDARVMTAFRAARATRALATPRPLWARAVAAASRFAPHSREAWAALTGVAFTPAVIVGLAAWAVFSHPAMTVGALASFAWWQVTDFGSTALTTLYGALPQGVDAFGARSLIDALSTTPALVVGGALVYSVLCALALRVLHRTLFTDRSRRDRLSHATFAS
jgi:anti-sigma factor RsiW